MKSNFKLLFMTLLLLFIGISAVNAQTIGDYRSVTNGNWSARTTWERWNGTSWVTPTTTEGYPGEKSNVPGTVTIQPGNIVTLNVVFPKLISTLDILANASLSIGADYAFNVETINLNTGQLYWSDNKATLTIPANSLINITSPGGLTGGCSNNVRLKIGTVLYAACTGQGGGAEFDFGEVNESGGSFYPIATSNSPICTGSNIELYGDNSYSSDDGIEYLWTVTPSVPIANPTSKNASIVNPAAGTYTVTLKATITSKGYSNIKSMQVVVAACNNWNGSTDSDWSKGANWSGGSVPSSNADIGFAANAINDLQLDADRTINNLVNNTTKKLIIPPAKTLTVNGALNIVDSNPDKIQIQAAANSANGSLILNNMVLYHNPNPYKNKPVYATVQMYTLGYKGDQWSWFDPVSNQTYTGFYRWQFFGVPVNSNDILYNNASLWGSYIRKYEESANLNTYYQKWNNKGNYDTLIPFAGYEITQTAAKTISFQGTLLTEDKILTLTNTSSGGIDYGSGYNIFGNSFTGAIDISKIMFPATGVDKTVYLYNTGSLYDWKIGPTIPLPIGNNAGEYLAIPQNLASIYIPSMQGFLLKATTNGAQVTIPYNSLIKPSSSTIQRVQRTEKANAFSFMTVDVAGQSGADRVWLYSEPGTSHEFDNGWDGEKIMITNNVALYAAEESGNYQVNTADDLDGTYLAFKAGTSNDYSLIINKSNLSGYASLYLTDLVTGIETDLSAVDSISYPFTASNTGTFDKRFMLSRISKVATGNEDVDKATVKIYGVEKSIRIQNPGNDNGTVQLFDITGKQIYTGIYQANATTEIKTGLQPGVYLVNVKSAGISQHKTVLIRP